MSNIPDKPLDHYPDATDIPALPPLGTEGEATVQEAKPAELDFLNAEKRQGIVTLDHPFMFEEKEVTEISVRRLKMVEIGDAYEKMKNSGYGVYEFYSAMSGFPPEVLQGLDADDGSQFLDIAYPLLPRLVRAYLTSAAGVDMPSSPVEP